jgi:hypothetical protein
MPNPEELKKEENPVNVANVVVTFASATIRTWALYPLDTTAKRLQFNVHSIKNFRDLQKTIFGSAHQQTIFCKAASLYHGIGWATFHRNCQLSLFNVGVPFAQSHVEYFFGGKSLATTILSSCAVGVVDAALLMIPDSRKVRAQTKGPQSGVFSNPYRAFPITTLRNSVFFTANASAFPHVKAALVKCEIFGDPTQKQANEKQEVLAKAASAAIGVACSNPTEVVRTRVQTLPQNSPENAFSITKKILKFEGVSAFSKSVIPRTFSNFTGFLAFFGLEAGIKKIVFDEPNKAEKKLTL